MIRLAVVGSAWHTFSMKRRRFIQGGLMLGLGAPLFAALRQERLDDAVQVLTRATASGEVASAAMHVTQRDSSFTRAFGKAGNGDAMFLLGSISKPINVTALMTLHERGEFKLSDPLSKFIPAFKGGDKDRVTMQHLLTHVSGLPDQLADNDKLRSQHASLGEFVEHAIRTPVQFTPGTKYQYSSMAILLGARVAEIISGKDILTLVDRTVFQPLKMKRSAQGLGRFKLEDMVPCQTDRAAPESGGGDPNAKNWDWNSPFWRKLGAPWGGVHASAPDIARFLGEFLNETGVAIKPETARLMVKNHNPPGLTPRGLGLAVGSSIASPGCSDKTFGHTGSTGTIAWADPATKTICVVLTSLPARAVTPHPRDLAATAVAASAK
jgi:CubicO group peptidase (beta-lactamase class C family)